jgi:hypothetical protein
MARHGLLDPSNIDVSHDLYTLGVLLKPLKDDLSTESMNIPLPISSAAPPFPPVSSHIDASPPSLTYHFGSPSSDPPPVVPPTRTKPLTGSAAFESLGTFGTAPPPMAAGSPLGSGKPHVGTNSTAFIGKSTSRTNPLSFRKLSSTFSRFANQTLAIAIFGLASSHKVA